MAVLWLAVMGSADSSADSSVDANVARNAVIAETFKIEYSNH
ncbi:MAG: hypothetical protein ACKV0T_08755 [Planctomycetales bacterium]